VRAYDGSVTPRLWNDTVDAHRRSVREATLDATAELVAAHGIAAVTMSQIAARTGIGRATLYKYFPDVESILVAWHERQVAQHLELLGDASGRLAAVLTAYAHLTSESHGVDPAGLLHSREHVTHAHVHLVTFISELIRQGVERGDLRDDVPADELAAFCLGAVGSIGMAGETSESSVRRLVTVTLGALDRPGSTGSGGR
jgi:AcrR family transcriptional regulator